MGVPGEWAWYVERVAREAGDTSQKAIARRVGVGTGTVSRWLSGENRAPQLDHVLRFAQAYDRVPLEGILMAEYAPTDRVEKLRELFMPRTGLSAYTSMELVEELAARLRGEDNS